jgi:hypothetical protein
MRLSAPPVSVTVDPNTAYRDDFLRLVTSIGLSREAAVLLVEASSSRPFDACTSAELLPVLDDLLALARRTIHTGPRPACCE